MNDGYILLHRKILKEWEWYSNINDTRLWIHCLLKANWEDGWFEGVNISRGSFVTSIKSLANETGLTPSQIRTSLAHLKKSGNLAIKTSNHFSIISINNYDKYQLDNKRLANESQTIDKQLACQSQQYNKEQLKTINNNNKENKKRKYGQFNNVLLSDDEYNKLKERFNDYNDKIENLSGYIASKGDKYKNHYATILNWARKEPPSTPEWFNKDFEPVKDGTEELEKLLEDFK